MGILSVFSADLASDLGTRQYAYSYEGQRHRFERAFDSSPLTVTQKKLSLRKRAEKMLGRTHRDIRTIRPMKDGVIADFEIAEGMLREFIKKIHANWLPSRRIVICVPSGVTSRKQSGAGFSRARRSEEVHLIGNRWPQRRIGLTS